MRGGIPGPAENPFWSFSLELYARPGVEAACLALQERRDLDVNLLLYCCWAGSRGRTLSRQELVRLIETVRPWREGAVRPLRTLRRWLKSPATAPPGLVQGLRARIKADELEAEAIQQRILLDALPIDAAPGTPVAVAANLGAHASALGRIPDGSDIADLTALVRGCFPDLTGPEAAHLLEFR